MYSIKLFHLCALLKYHSVFEVQSLLVIGLYLWKTNMDYNFHSLNQPLLGMDITRWWATIRTIIKYKVLTVDIIPSFNVCFTYRNKLPNKSLQDTGNIVIHAEINTRLILLSLQPPERFAHSFPLDFHSPEQRSRC